MAGDGDLTLIPGAANKSASVRLSVCGVGKGAVLLDCRGAGRDCLPSRGESGSAVHSDVREDNGEDGLELGESFLRPDKGLLRCWYDSNVGVLGGEE